MPIEILDNMDETNFSIKEHATKKIAVAINSLMTLKMPQWKFGFETGLSFSPIGHTLIPGFKSFGGFGLLFDFNYDKKTFEVLDPIWEELGPEPKEYSGEVEEEKKEQSAILNTENEEFTF